VRKSGPGLRRARTAPADAAAVADRRARAVEEPLDVRLRSVEPYPLLEVRNPLHGTEYLVMLPEFPSKAGALCTCTDFARRGLGTCKHVEAAFRWRSENPGAPAVRPPKDDRSRVLAAWRKIDQRIAASGKDSGPASRRWRRAGAALFEESTEG
jgi:hypothetical protein